jgi:hypothetical protein
VNTKTIHDFTFMILCWLINDLKKKQSPLLQPLLEVAAGSVSSGAPNGNPLVAGLGSRSW